MPRPSLPYPVCQPMKTEHLLIIRFSALGDVAMTVPVVASLARQYPHLRITVLSRPAARPLFEGLASNVGFMEADLKGEYHGWTGLNALYRRLAAKNFTAVADFHNILRSNYLRMRFNLDRFRVEHIDKHRRERRLLVSHSDKAPARLQSPFSAYADVLERLGYPVKVEFDSIFSPEGAPLDTIADRTGTKTGGQAWIGIAPFAAHKGKIYPVALMEQVIARLTEQYPDDRIFLFGGGKYERQQIDRWTAAYPSCTSVPATLSSLAEELVLMSHLDVMVSMDSANMHLASSVGTRVVSVWGATHPRAGFLGWGQHEDDCVGLDLPCRPCSIYGNKPCIHGDYRCLSGIKPEEIVERIKKHGEK